MTRGLACDRGGDGAEMLQGAAAAAAYDVDEAGLGPLLDLVGHLLGGQVVLPHLVGESGVGVERAVKLSHLRHVFGTWGRNASGPSAQSRPLESGRI